MSKPSDLVQGTLDLLLLKIVGLEPLHAWAISQRLKQVSGTSSRLADGSLDPALHKLEQEGWIQAEWKITVAWAARQVLFAYVSGPAGAGARGGELGNGWRARISHVVRLNEA